MHRALVLAWLCFWSTPSRASTRASALPELLYAKANEAQARLDWAASLEAVVALEELAPDYKIAGFLHGFALQRLGRDLEAIDRYRIFLATHPRFVQGRFNLAFALMQQARWREAADEFQRTLDLDPGYWEVHLHLGKCLDKLGDGQAAALHLQIWNRK